MTSNPLLPEKITQLQCFECNQGLQSIFLNWLTDSFKFTPNLLARFHQELQALLAAAEFAYTVGRDRPQAGDFLQNITYQPLSKRQKTLFFLLTVLLPYLLKRVTAFAAGKDSPFWKILHSWLVKVERLLTVAEFVNYADTDAEGVGDGDEVHRPQQQANSQLLAHESHACVAGLRTVPQNCAPPTLLLLRRTAQEPLLPQLLPAARTRKERLCLLRQLVNGHAPSSSPMSTLCLLLLRNCIQEQEMSALLDLGGAMGAASLRH